MSEMQTRAFPPEVFARLAPDVYFARHLAQGLRPTGRRFDEARAVEVRPGAPDSLNGALGSAVVRAGGATVICGITGGLTNFTGEGGVYANVEIHRGGAAGKPTVEEQVISMELQRLIAAAAISESNFAVGEHEELCLMAQIVVLSRTGPALDLAWQSLVAALKACRVPVFVQNERTLAMEPSTEFKHLELPDSLPTQLASFGVVADGTLLADIDGEVEEECVPDRISVARTESDTLVGFSVASPNGFTTRDVIASVLARTRSTGEAMSE